MGQGFAHGPANSHPKVIGNQIRIRLFAFLTSLQNQSQQQLPLQAKTKQYTTQSKRPFEFSHFQFKVKFNWIKHIYQL